MLSRLDAALWYARKGWAVFPCNGKVPACEHGVLEATSDEVAIRSWWSSTPHNIGIATGQVSGIWVLDIDGEEGEESLVELEREHGALPTTVEQLTGKGRHLVFKYTQAIRNRTAIRPGIDVRGDGGYIIAAPSYHPETGRTYTSCLFVREYLFPRQALWIRAAPPHDIKSNYKGVCL